MNSNLDPRQPEKVQIAARQILQDFAAQPHSPAGAPPSAAEIVPLIDHTLLKPDATAEQVKTLCAEARQYGFAAVCVNPAFVPLCKAELNGSPAKVATVIGFPLGATLAAVKAYETKTAVEQGASEVDMVLNIGALKGKDYTLAMMDIAGVVGEAHTNGAAVKVIIETCLLDDEEKVIACLLSRQAGADFVKTSTGFSTGGASEHDIRLMRFVVGPGMGVKASGGVRSLEDAQKMVQAGANRIGASAGVKIAQASGESAPGY